MIVQMPDVIEHNSLEAPTPEVSRLDIIKAVVYGGLVQSITSLCVVVSAAGGDASTLNIVALALANVFGGLIVLSHNLRALKQEQNTEHYEQQLGRPGHFLLHATTAIMSYLVFGLMTPIIYGFSFYKSDNKYLKLAALAGVSFVCITLLSTGKAFVQRPPKAYMKTVLSYIGLGIMVAGPGYIAGDLANMLLKKFEVFDSSSSGSMSVIEAKVVNGAWSSY
ncbi:membrane protein of ER body-like protein [Chenopodium quinoa]|uniref:membrane protein of ER body-like protein n=1 Tax=Chenopodium quinoa TaxID=63459 RepID=UPI000B78309E|nr:membrane protein of ER body-like protein [Chenopodium quinoa]